MNVFLTCYFNGKKDPQRGITWEVDDSALDPLKNSVTSPLIIFTDCLPIRKNKAQYIYRECKRSPYFERWEAYFDYLLEHPEIENVFCLDATDIVMVNSPFDNIQDKIYIGDESQFLGTEWMIANHPEPFLQDFFRANRKKKLLNGGIVGGNRANMLSFLSSFVAYSRRYKRLGKTDMGLLNYLVYTRFKGKISNGEPINSVFKKYEERDDVYFLHK